MLNDKDEVHIPDDTKLPDDFGKILISGLKNILTDKQKNEEEDGDNHDNYDPSAP